MKSARRHLLKLIGIGLFLWLLSRYDLRAILGELKGVNWRLYAIALVAFIPTVIVKSLRWRLLVEDGSDVRLPGFRAFSLYASGIFLGACTPGRLGELLRVEHARREGATIGRAVAATVLDRASDVITLLGLGAVAILLHFGPGSTWTLHVIELLALLAAAGLAAVILRKRLLAMLARIVRRLLSLAHAEQVEREAANMGDTIKGYRAGTWIATAAITFTGWTFYFGQRFFFARAAGVEIDLLFCSAVMAIIALLALLPISILSIGTRDAALIFFLVPMGASPERAIALSGLILLAMLINTTLSGLIFLFTRQSAHQHAAAEPVGMKHLFIVGTGRTGTVFMREAFGTNVEDSLAIHEPDHIIKLMSNMRMAGRVQKPTLERYFTHYMARVHRRMERDGQRNLVQVDPWLYGFMDVIEGVVPDAHVVHVVRHPFTYIPSHLNRIEKKAHIAWLRHHIPYWLLRGDHTPQYTRAQWRALAPEVQMAWYWRHCNEHIEAAGKELARFTCVRYEDLFADGNPGLHRIVEFAELPTAPEGLTVPPGRRNTASQKFSPVEEWPEETLKQVVEICGPLAARYGYDLGLRSPVAQASSL